VDEQSLLSLAIHYAENLKRRIKNMNKKQNKKVLRDIEDLEIGITEDVFTNETILKKRPI